MKKEIKAIVEGGAAKPMPPLGPALSAAKLNVGEVIKKINEATASFKGLKVPVVIRYEGQEFEIEVGVPPTAELIKKEAGIEKGSGAPGSEVAGDISLEKVIEIAKSTFGKSEAKSLKARVKEVLGTCVSMGVTVDGKDPREIDVDALEGI
ncbi:MAG: 50S ribosomal protein L11 [Candidatus Micrarchaeota archaeon]|nr:50S ribosomal protein L11 [Candidatus Micrarchaeota archaeon]